MKEKKFTSPACFTPEPKAVYPLCVGQKGWACERCCLYRDYEMGKQMTFEDFKAVSLPNEQNENHDGLGS